MKPFGTFLMCSRRNAGILAFAFALLPFLNWLSVVITLLVTLRKGAKEGAWILVCTLLPICVLALVSHDVSIFYNMVIPIVVAWILAILLHKTHNWALTILIGVAIGVFVIVVMHSYISGINAWWQERMLAYLQQLGTQMNVNTEQQRQMILHLSKVATGLQMAALLLVDLLWLLLARYWQAVLYNPGALRSELQIIRMPRWASGILAVVLVIAVLTKLQLIVDVLPMVLLPFALAGLSLVHFIMTVRKAHWIWLVLFYVVLVFALPYISMGLVVLALVDSLMNLRRRYRAVS